MPSEHTAIVTLCTNRNSELAGWRCRLICSLSYLDAEMGDAQEFAISLNRRARVERIHFFAGKRSSRMRARDEHTHSFDKQSALKGTELCTTRVGSVWKAAFYTAASRRYSEWMSFTQPARSYGRSQMEANEAWYFTGK